MPGEAVAAALHPAGTEGLAANAPLVVGSVSDGCAPFCGRGRRCRVGNVLEREARRCHCHCRPHGAANGGVEGAILAVQSTHGLIGILSTASGWCLWLSSQLPCGNLGGTQTKIENLAENQGKCSHIFIRRCQVAKICQDTAAVYSLHENLWPIMDLFLVRRLMPQKHAKCYIGPRIAGR